MDRIPGRREFKPVLSVIAFGVACGLVIGSLTTTVHLANGTQASLFDGRGAAAVPRVHCPRVNDKLPPVPASAAAEVRQKLTPLRTQTNEANQCLVRLSRR